MMAENIGSVAMAGKRYGYGTAAEYRLQEELRAEGFDVVRTRGSKGHWDLIATRADVVWFISVKRCNTWKRAGTVYRGERRRLEALPLPSTPKLKKVLAIWSDELNPETPGRGGIWFCKELVESPKPSPQPSSASRK